LAQTIFAIPDIGVGGVGVDVRLRTQNRRSAWSSHRTMISLVLAVASRSSATVRYDTHRTASGVVR
jgi:hypothetical protein